MSYNLSLMPITRWDPAAQFSGAPQNPPTPLLLFQPHQQQCFQNAPTSDYPMDAIPGVLGRVFKAVCDSGIDPPVVGAVFKATAAALTKGITDIEWVNGDVTPVGANEMVVAGTVSGKSYAQKIAINPIVTFLDSEECKTSPISPMCFIEDTNSPELLGQLSENPNGFLASEEAGQLVQFFKNNAGTAAKVLDSQTVRYARSTTGRIEVKNPRLTALLELQPDIFETNKFAFGVGTGSVAVINRFFIGNSTNAADTGRMHRNRIPDSTLSLYQSRAEQLLESLMQQRKSAKPRTVLRLSPEAKEYLIWTSEDIKIAMSPRMLGHDISLYLGRHAERVLKLSGVFHAFEHGPLGEVELATVQASDRLARWSCKSFHELTFIPPRLSQLDMDTFVLERELLTASTQTGLTEFKFNEVRRNSPNIGLTTQRFNRAFAKLAGTGRVQRRKIGAIEWVQVVPHHYWGNLGSSRLID